MKSLGENVPHNTIDKVRKLIEHERSARTIGSLAEAEAFAAKIHEILFRHKLSMSDIEVAQEDVNDPVRAKYTRVQDMVNCKQTRVGSWIFRLLWAVAQANFCDGVRIGSNRFCFVGRMSDVERAKILFKNLYDIAVEVAPRACEEYAQSEQFFRDAILNPWSSPAGLKRAFTNGWKLGYSAALRKRLRSEGEQLKSEAGTTALIRLDQLHAKVQAAIKKHFPVTSRERRSTTTSAAGYETGRSYGAAVGINSHARLTA